VKGEDDKTITAGSLVTVSVELRREPLIDVSFADNDFVDDVQEEQDDKAEDADEDELAPQVSDVFYRTMHYSAKRRLAIACK